MRLSGYQPQYFPRLHYFARALNSDIFTLSDNVQFVRSHVYASEDGKRRRGPSYQAHTLIKSSNGTQQLAVYVHHDGLQPINEITLNTEHDWTRKHATAVRLGYAHAPFGPTLNEQIDELLSHSYNNLAELNIKTFIWGLAWILGEKDNALTHSLESINDLLKKSDVFRLKRIVVKSQAGIAPSDNDHDATDVIIATCQKLGANEYYAGGTARLAYLNIDKLEQAGVRFTQQEWQAEPYDQQFPRVPFIPNLSIIDMLANEKTTNVQHLLTTREQVAP